jgi:glycosyltransferase involved in cell wall biosynthesis
VTAVRIDQVVPSLGARDAVGRHVLQLRDLIRAHGHPSDIWVQGVFPELRSEARLIDTLEPDVRPGTIWLYHLAVGSPLAELLRARPEPLAVDYHNVTPAELLGSWVPDWARQSAVDGRRQVSELASRACYAVADSAYNAADLHAAGYRAVEVAAPLFPSAAVAPDATTCRFLAQRRRADTVDWLFVGRLAPNKAQHDLVKAVAAAERWLGRRCRLRLVGTGLGDRYASAVRRFADRLGLGDRVELVGSVDDAVLAAHYAAADVFVSASDHEGFGIPLVEAMAAGVPVVAYATTAVAETVAGGGLLLDRKDPLTLAYAAVTAADDPVLRGRLVAAGRRRAAELGIDRVRRRWAEVIPHIVAAASNRRGGLVEVGR